MTGKAAVYFDPAFSLFPKLFKLILIGFSAIFSVIASDQANAQSATKLQWRFDAAAEHRFSDMAKNASFGSALKPGRLATSKSFPGKNPSFGEFLSIKSNPPKSTSGFAKALDKTVEEGRIYEECDARPETCVSKLRQWRQLIKKLRQHDRSGQIPLVNAAINRLVRFRNDKPNYGRLDYWASPIETLANGGDCEDFSILKYVTLKELGFSEDALRVVVVRDTIRNAGHAVLTVEHNGEKLILDNQLPAPVNSGKITRYSPVYGVSGNKRWIYLQYKQRTRPQKVVHTN